MEKGVKEKIKKIPYFFMNVYLIDTSVIINYLRDKGSAVETVNNLNGELTSSYICLAELYEGIWRVREREKAEKGILNFFAGLSQVFGVDEDIAKTFGQIRADLKEKGAVIEDLDIILAATCIANNSILITANPKHFSRVANLKLLAVN
ncbi:type II toxin-antitoxin system VapC family toxin [Candidatus Daviesbacteria bacterium]|nr:type II toxin-antitoxin system VapC family toxin [Candidatus Daviesbacteria bacterium]